jgi:hypothetical protein
MEPDGKVQPEQSPEQKEPVAAPKKRRNWLPWALAVVALIVGAWVGFAIGDSDPTKSDRYRDALTIIDRRNATIDELQAEVGRLEGNADFQRDQRRESMEEMRQREAELAAAEAAVAARESAVTATEEAVAARSVGAGTWTVGVDIEPGTYRTDAPVVGQCYWAILAAGSNGRDIISNDIVNGGFPTVTLSEGQIFENNRCGTFVKQ